MRSDPIDIEQTPLHLGLGAAVAVLPAWTGDMSWYEDYGAAHGADGNEGRLVSVHTFDADWDQWEVHPQGHEIVLCLEGTIRLHQELLAGTTVSVEIAPGQAVINEPGVWHTADVVGGPVKALFITAGLGTEGRPR
ncbi:MAG: cupin domain-containing protein [Actinomycetota bacterium]